MGSLQNYFGEIAALATALCWAVTSTSFEHSAKKIGSMNLNLLRLLLGLIFLSVFTGVTRGYLFPRMRHNPNGFGFCYQGSWGL